MFTAAETLASDPGSLNAVLRRVARTAARDCGMCLDVRTVFPACRRSRIGCSRMTPSRWPHRTRI